MGEGPVGKGPHLGRVGSWAEESKAAVGSGPCGASQTESRPGAGCCVWGMPGFRNCTCGHQRPGSPVHCPQGPLESQTPGPSSWKLCVPEICHQRLGGRRPSSDLQGKPPAPGPGELQTHRTTNGGASGGRLPGGRGPASPAGPLEGAALHLGGSRVSIRLKRSNSPESANDSTS